MHERERIESALCAYMANDNAVPVLNESMAYSLLDGGKRIRPYLLLLVNAMLGGSETVAMPFACALEMVHCYSLIHDDLPAMDNDAMRRGKPSNHVRFGEANAILAGDGLLTKAAVVLLSQDGFDDAKRAIIDGAYAMVSGQSDDLNLTERSAETLHRIHLNKTGALFRAACMAGAYLSDASKAEEMRAFGETLGLLFQMTDDLLDEEKDRLEGKLTYVTFYGREETKAFIADAYNRAEAILAPYTGEAAMTLRNLVQSLRSRTY
ncbi:MAG: polyprenyl synthetase family protein [Clostridia bacterium]|nr:polyprenyl synthetase family protein [Clostridia bacterium]